MEYFLTRSLSWSCLFEALESSLPYKIIINLNNLLILRGNSCQRSDPRKSMWSTCVLDMRNLSLMSFSLMTCSQEVNYVFLCDSSSLASGWHSVDVHSLVLRNVSNSWSCQSFVITWGCSLLLVTWSMMVGRMVLMSYWMSMMILPFTFTAWASFSIIGSASSRSRRCFINFDLSKGVSNTTYFIKFEV